MSDSKKYYYMKVKDNFFNTEEMVLLETMPNGIAYQNLYLKLCLLSIKSEGALKFKDFMPYDVPMLSTVLRTSIDTVKTGIEIFMKLGLVEIVDGQTFYMTDIQTMIGQSSSEADRIRNYRKKLTDKKNVSNGVTESVQMYEKRTPEIEIEKEIEKEIDIPKEPLTTVSEEKKTESSNIIRIITDKYCEVYQSVYGEKFTPVAKDYWKRAVSQIKATLKNYTLEQICNAFDMAKKDNWAISQGFGLSLILSRNMLDKYLNPNYQSGQKNDKRTDSYDWDKI